jgi:hypothetical protein
MGEVVASMRILEEAMLRTGAQELHVDDPRSSMRFGSIRVYLNGG